MKKLLIGFCSFLVGAAVFAATRNVPADGDLATVVAAAGSGDEVVLAASGSPYALTDTLTVPAGVTVRGATGNWKDVVLKMTVTGKRAVSLSAGATLSGVTVTGADYAGSGSGVYVSAAGALLANCRVTGCKSANTSNGNYTPAGGAVANYGGTVSSCVIDGNGRNGTQTSQHGPIAYQSLVAGALMENCVITNNVDQVGQSAGTLGKSGGLSSLVLMNDGTMRYTLIADNDLGPITVAGDATTYGVALALINANATAEHCTIVRNHYYAGWRRQNLVAVMAQKGTFSNNIVTGNGAWGETTFDDLNIAAAVKAENNVRTCLPDLGPGDVSLPATAVAALGAFPSDRTGFVCSFSASEWAPVGVKTVQLTAHVAGTESACTYEWDLDGDGTYEVSSGASASFTPTAVGSHRVGLRVTAETPTTFASTINVRQDVFFVDAASTHSTPPYATAQTAATSVNDALALALSVPGSEVRIATGNYPLSVTLPIARCVRVKGVGATRDAVTLTAPDKARAATLQGFGTMLANLTVTSGYGVQVSEGATVTNCRVTAASTTQNVSVSGLGIYNNDANVLSCTVDAITGHNKTTGAYYQAGAHALADRCVVTNCVNNNVCNGNGYPGYAGVCLAGGEMRNSYITDILCGWSKAGDDATLNGGAALVVNRGATFINGAVLNTTVTASTASGHPVRVDAGGMLLNSILNGNTRNTAADDSFGDGTYTNSYLSSVTDAQAANGCVALKGDEYVRVPGGLYTVPDTSALIDKGADMAWMNDGGLDVAGNSRCVNGRLDIGAIENQKEKSAFWCRIDTEKTTGIGRLLTTLKAYQEGAAGDVTYSWDLDGEYEINDRTSVVYDSSTVGTVAVSLKAEDGVSDPTTFSFGLTVLQGVYYVDANGADPVPPYDTPAHAATNVADAVAIMDDGAEVRLAAGDYTLTNTVSLQGGSRLTGAGATRDEVVVRGTGKRLFTLTGAGTMLANVTLTRLPSDEAVSGGAVYANGGTTVTNCHVTNPTFVFGRNGNPSPNGYAIYSQDARVVDCEISDIAVNQAVYGIALYQSGDNALTERCILRDLTTTWWQNGSSYPCCGGIVVAGGTVRNTLVTGCRINALLTKDYSLGAWIQNQGRAENCTVVGTVMGTGYNNASCSNKTAAVSGSGAFENCLVYDNLTLGEQKNLHADLGSYAYCCTTTNGLVGEGNVAATPGCYAFRGNGRLVIKGSSPCINAGTNRTWMADATDLYGNPRICRSRVDIGAVESQSGGLMLVVR